MNGFFITFEGIDFSGKTTQANLLISALQRHGIDFIFVREPGGTHISEDIRNILLDPQNEIMYPRTELLLYAAARAQIVEEVIRPALAENKVVICDRYADSTAAYQGFGREQDQADIANAISLATKNLVPHLTLLFDISLQTAHKRFIASGQSADRMEAEKDAFRNRVRNGYHIIANRDHDRVVLLNAEKSVEDLQKEVWRIFIERANTINFQVEVN